MTFRSGHVSKLQVGGVELDMTAGSFLDAAEELDVTSTTGGGFREVIAGIRTGELEATVNWKDDKLPSSNPPNLVAGQSVTVEFHLIDGKKFAGTLFCREVEYRTAVRDKISYRLRGRMSGSYTLPS